jgi:hypothetical protein
MSTTRSSLRAGVVVIAPVIWLAVLSYHPYLEGRLPNVGAVAEAVEADPARWGAVHLATGLASGVLALAFLAVRAHLHDAGEDRWSAAALPWVIIGCTLYAMLPGLEFAPLAAVESGGSAEAAQEALTPWFVSLLVASGVTFAAGMFGFALGVRRSGLLSPGVTGLVVVALIVMALSRVVPLAAVQFYVQGLAGLVALLPLAGSMWRRRAAAVPARQPVPQAT